MSEKSILEQALLQVQTLEEAVKQNAKGILASTMKQELNDLLKESLEEEEEVEASEEEETEVAEQPDPEEEDEDDMSSETSDTDDEDENLDNLDNEDPMKNVDDESVEFGDESEDESDEFGDESDEFGDESDDMPSDMSGDDVLDMTGASDDEVLKVFKAMKPEDGVVVKKDGNEIDIDLGDDEFIIKLDEEGDESEMSEGDVMPDMDTNEEFGMEDENVYEVEIDEEEEVEEEETHKIEATEAARTKSNPHGNKNGMNRAGLPSKKKYKAGSGVFGINEEVEKLKKQNSEYKKALVLFKDKLNEVAVFNASLAYATRLFTEHSTTKQEKLNILKRFDSVSNMNESKGLYNTIKSELVTKKPVTESVVEKISNTPSTSASQQVLAESKAYENPQFKRMKDLMSKLK
jgi:hypothetical protein